MNPGSTELEQRITDAFADWADALPERTLPLARAADGRESRVARRRSSGRRVLIAAMATALVVAAGIGIWANRADNSSTHVSSGHITDGRVEVVLHEERITPELRSWLVAAGFDFGSDPIPLAVRPDGHEPILVFDRSPIPPPYSSPRMPTMSGCIAVAAPSPGGYVRRSLRCFEFGAPEWPPGLPNGSIHDLPADARDRLAYATWNDVPEGATRVTYDSDALHAWQVPIRGLAVFPVPVDRGATFQAFAADGRLLEAQTIKAPKADPPTISPTREQIEQEFAGVLRCLNENGVEVVSSDLSITKYDVSTHLGLSNTGEAAKNGRQDAVQDMCVARFSDVSQQWTEAAGLPREELDTAFRDCIVEKGVARKTSIEAMDQVNVFVPCMRQARADVLGVR